MTQKCVWSANGAKSVFTTHSPFRTHLTRDFAWDCVVKIDSIIRLQGVGANFSAPQLAPKLIISTFENRKDLTVSCPSIWCEEAGVNYFVFDSHFKPKKRVQYVPLPFVGVSEPPRYLSLIHI